MCAVVIRPVEYQAILPVAATQRLCSTCSAQVFGSVLRERFNNSVMSVGFAIGYQSFFSGAVPKSALPCMVIRFLSRVARLSGSVHGERLCILKIYICGHYTSHYSTRVGGWSSFLMQNQKVV